MQVHHIKTSLLYLPSEADMADSKNDGFTVLDHENRICKVRFLGTEKQCKADDPEDPLYENLRKLILAVICDYSYLIP